ncbi:MAG TPA: leucyl/phenylalanyl-tRNA--protein transferase [Hanamia sp.]|nr:leucyl/phenylalanyl-tRNA--protein transferase [Hanamia sp.]
MNDEAIYDFPEPIIGDEYGLVAIGGNLSTGTLINAYKKGIFPWFNPGEIIQWFSPDPRFVLFPEKIKVSHSMKNVVNKNIFKFTVDYAFREVVHGCRLAKRDEGNSSWIGEEIEDAYFELFEKGIAHSAEAWQNDQLVGGLYGVLLGKIFFGESMFTAKSNASKFAFIKYVQKLQKDGIELIDCQVHTNHLESLGAEFITGTQFNSLLKKLIPQ